MGAVHGVFSGPLGVGRDRPLTARTKDHSGIMPERLGAGAYSSEWAEHDSTVAVQIQLRIEADGK